MGTQKKMSVPWTILLIAFALFQHSAAFPKLLTPELQPSFAPGSPRESPPPSWPKPPPSAAPPMPAYQPPPAAAAPPPIPAYPPPPAAAAPPPIPAYPSPSPPTSVPPTMPYPMPPSPSSVPPSRAAIKGGYWPSWLAEKSPASSIPTQYFTHLFYSFVPLDSSTYQLSIKQADDQWMSNFTATLHSKPPPAKALLSIGGSSFSPDTFSSMASNPDNRANFINSTIWIARKYNFDGLDLAWEFPNTREDMSNLSLLLKEWQAALVYESEQYGKPRLLLSSAVYFSSSFFLSDKPRSYPADAIKNYVDFVNPMCFDYHGNWDTSATGEHALLFDNTSNISTSAGISSWKMAGVPPEKLVMGLPLYGRTWKLKDPNKSGIGAAAVGVGPGTNGIMTYSEIDDFNSANGAFVVYDNVTVSTYSYKGSDWIGYDGPVSLANKIKYAKTNGLGGYFLWALAYDKNWTLSKIASSTWDSQSF